MATFVKLEGGKELARALEELPKTTARNTLDRGLKKVAKPVQTVWKSLAPKDEGHYAESIIVGKRLTRPQARDAKREGKHFAEIHVGTADPAGMQQEFGNINHPAQPSGRPAWDATKDNALKDFGTELGKEIEKSAARLAKKAAKFG